MTTTRVAEPRMSTQEFLTLPATREKLAVVQTKVLQPEKVVRFALNAMQKTPLLRETTKESLLGALMTATSLGLEPNTALEHCWVLPYRNRRKIGNQWQTVIEAQLVIGYRGYVALAYRFADLATLEADAICEGDTYESFISSEVETARFFKHQKALKSPGEPYGAYCFTRLNRGGKSFDMVTELPLEEIEKIRDRSETYRALQSRLAEATSDAERAKAQRNFDETPWVMWWRSMWAKTAIRRHVKQFPLTVEMTAATAIEDAADMGRLDLAKMGDADLVRAVRAGEAPPPIDADYEDTTPQLDTGEEGGGEPAPAEEPPKPKQTRRRKKPADKPAETAPAEPEKPTEEAPPLAQSEHADPAPERPAEPAAPPQVEDNDDLFAD